MSQSSNSDQLQALKKNVQRICLDPGKLKAVVIGVILLFGFVLFCRPQAARLEVARAKLKKAKTRARIAKDVRHVVEQAAKFMDRLPPVDDVGDWQDYIMKKVGAAGAKLRKLEPRRGLMKGKYRITIIEVEAEGMFADIVDLIDRLERGDRIVRLDRLAIEKRSGSVNFRCVLMGLARLRG